MLEPTQLRPVRPLAAIALLALTGALLAVVPPTSRTSRTRAPQGSLFLTPSETTEFSVNTSLEQLDIERIVVVGGPAAVDASVVEHYDDEYTVERWAGPDRHATAATVADNAIERLGFTADLTLLARGDDFPDALAAGVHGGAEGAPILLSATATNLGQATGDWLADACPHVGTIRALGGTAAVSSGTLEAAIDAAEACLNDAENKPELHSSALRSRSPAPRQDMSRSST